VLASRSDLLERAQALPGGRLLAALAGPDVHLVGGTVRDLLLGEAPRELDLVVERPLVSVLAKLDGSKVLHGRFETASVLTSCGGRIDLARSRRERYPRPGALPQVEPAPLAEDLLRRDFTVNALALTLGGPNRGELHGPPQALADLERRQLRVLHPRSFRDDPTRLLRLARYQARLSFSVEPQTELLAREALAAGVMETVSCARIGGELFRNLGEPGVVAQLQALQGLGLTAALGLSTPPLAAVEDALGLLGEGGQPARVGGLALLAGSKLAASGLAGCLARTGLRRSELHALVGGVARLEEARAALRRGDPPSALYQLLGRVPVEAVALAGALEGGAARERAGHYLDRVRSVALSIRGEDLVEAGVRPGPAIGKALAQTRARLLDGELGGGREAELAAAVRVARQLEGGEG